MRPPSDTIAAIATPPGQGGVAVVRVSGPDARFIVEALLERVGGVGIPEARRVYLGRFRACPGGATIDQVLVFAMLGPQSYTGEDVVEIQCHGGSIVTQRILDSVVAAGARVAAPGEFTKRAFLNGRMDLAQAEAVADLIAARSSGGARLAWSQLQGQLSRRIGGLRSVILKVRALCEAAIDFPDEEVPELDAEVLGGELGRVRAELDGLAAGFERARVRYEGARVVLVGKPNVGKSSLLNALLGRERAIVTPIAGTTRDVVEAEAILGEVPTVIADTAGIHEATNSIERLGMERSKAAIDDAGCVVAVFDRSRALDASDRMVADVVAGRPLVTALNKCDLPAMIDSAAVRASIRGPVVEVSACTGDGLAALATAVARALTESRESVPDDEVVIFRARHRDAVQRACEDLRRAETALASAAPLELIASDLEAAARALAALTGEITTEDVLDRVFAEFCIGK